MRIKYENLNNKIKANTDSRGVVIYHKTTIVMYYAVLNHKAGTVYFSSKQLLPYGFAEQM